MLNITVREATEEEKLNIDEDEDLPKGVVAFDSCDWQAVFFMCLREGDYFVDIPSADLLNSQATGTFLVQMKDDGGYFKKIQATKA